MASRRSAPAPNLPIPEAIGRALHLHRTGKLAPAEQAYRDVLRREPSHPHALHFFGMFLHERGHIAAAIGHLERSLESEPGVDQVENNLAGLYLLADRPADAERIFTGLIARSPDSVPARFNLGVLYARAKRWPEAVDQLQASRALVVDLDVLRELGEALVAVGRFEEAVAAHQEALSLLPTDADQRKRLSEAYLILIEHFDRQSTDPATVIAHLRDWRAIDPENATVRARLAAHEARAEPISG